MEARNEPKVKKLIERIPQLVSSREGEQELFKEISQYAVLTQANVPYAKDQLLRLIVAVEKSISVEKLVSELAKILSFETIIDLSHGVLLEELKLVLTNNPANFDKIFRESFGFGILRALLLNKNNMQYSDDFMKDLLPSMIFHIFEDLAIDVQNGKLEPKGFESNWDFTETTGDYIFQVITSHYIGTIISLSADITPVPEAMKEGASEVHKLMKEFLENLHTVFADKIIKIKFTEKNLPDFLKQKKSIKINDSNRNEESIVENDNTKTDKSEEEDDSLEISQLLLFGVTLYLNSLLLGHAFTHFLTVVCNLNQNILAEIDKHNINHRYAVELKELESVINSRKIPDYTKDQEQKYKKDTKKLKSYFDDIFKATDIKNGLKEALKHNIFKEFILKIFRDNQNYGEPLPTVIKYCILLLNWEKIIAPGIDLVQHEITFLNQAMRDGIFNHAIDGIKQFQKQKTKEIEEQKHLEKLKKQEEEKKRAEKLAESTTEATKIEETQPNESSLPNANDMEEKKEKVLFSNFLSEPISMTRQRHSTDATPPSANKPVVINIIKSASASSGLPSLLPMPSETMSTSATNQNSTKETNKAKTLRRIREYVDIHFKSIELLYAKLALIYLDKPTKEPLRTFYISTRAIAKRFKPATGLFQDEKKITSYFNTEFYLERILDLEKQIENGIYDAITYQYLLQVIQYSFLIRDNDTLIAKVDTSFRKIVDWLEEKESSMAKDELYKKILIGMSYLSSLIFYHHNKNTGYDNSMDFKKNALEKRIKKLYEKRKVELDDLAKTLFKKDADTFRQSFKVSLSMITASSTPLLLPVPPAVPKSKSPSRGVMAFFSFGSKHHTVTTKSDDKLAKPKITTKTRTTTTGVHITPNPLILQNGFTQFSTALTNANDISKNDAHKNEATKNKGKPVKTEPSMERTNANP